MKAPLLHHAALMALLLNPPAAGRDGRDGKDTVAALVTDVAFVSGASGADYDDAGRGSLAKPWKTVTAAVARCMPAPTTQAEYLRARVVVLLPGTYAENVAVPTLANAIFLLFGATLTGELSFDARLSLQFASSTPPNITVQGFGTCSIGDGVHAFKQTQPGGDNSTAFGHALRGLSVSGEMVESNCTGAGSSVIVECSVTGTVTTGFSFNMPLSTASDWNKVSFTREVSCAKLSTLSRVTFFQRVTYVSGGAASNLTTTGLRSVMFSPNAAVKQVVCSSGTGTLRLDDESNWSLVTAGWAVKPATVPVQQQWGAALVVPSA